MSLQVHAIQISPFIGMSTVNPNWYNKLKFKKKKTWSQFIRTVTPQLIVVRYLCTHNQNHKTSTCFPPNCCNNPVCCYMADPQPLELYPRVPLFQDVIYINYMSPAGLLFWHIRMQNVFGSRWRPVLLYCMPKLLDRTGWVFFFSFLFLLFFFLSKMLKYS